MTVPVLYVLGVQCSKHKSLPTHVAARVKTNSKVCLLNDSLRSSDDGYDSEYKHLKSTLIPISDLMVHNPFSA